MREGGKTTSVDTEIEKSLRWLPYYQWDREIHRYDSILMAMRVSSKRLVCFNGAILNNNKLSIWRPAR